LAALVAIALFLSTPTFSEPAADTLLREEFAVGSFHSATRLAVNAQGWVYVIDNHENTATLIKGADEKVSSVGSYGWSATSFDNPTGITTDGLSVYISDFNNHRIQRFDRNLNNLSSFSTRDSSAVATQFGFPSGVALSRFGDLFILDSENSRVMKFAPRLRFERSFAGLDAERGRLRQPVKIIVAPSDHLYVLESDRLIEFDYFGNLLRIIGEGILQGAQGFDVANEGIVITTKDSVLWFSIQGQLSSAQAVSTILTSTPISSLQDVVLSGDRVYFLTPHQVVVMKKIVR
jgi:DNA-binding beta-propeller fold protein YncE